MYIVIYNDDLGGWIECTRFEDQDEAINLRDQLQVNDPYHRYKIVVTE